MNPFTESTVARPMPDGPCSRFAGAAGKVRHRTGRSLAVLTLGLMTTVCLSDEAHAVDVNVATQEQLRDVRGIGPKTAQIIVEERSRGGRYESLEDLSDRVKGIGPKKAAALKASGLAVGAPSPASATFSTAGTLQAGDKSGVTKSTAGGAAGATASMNRPRHRAR